MVWRPFAYYNPRSSWTTPPLTIGPAADSTDSTVYSTTWPKRGMTRQGVASTPPAATHGTAASPCSDCRSLQVLPTPTAANPNDAEDPARWLARQARHRARGINGNGMGTPLSIAVRLLPTPIASDAKNCTRRTQTGGPSLPDQVQLLPTPRASDSGTAGRRASRGFRPPLSQQILPLVTPNTLLPTPLASDGTKGCPRQRGSKGDLTLPSTVVGLHLSR